VVSTGIVEKTASVCGSGESVVLSSSRNHQEGLSKEVEKDKEDDGREEDVEYYEDEEGNYYDEEDVEYYDEEDGKYYDQDVGYDEQEGECDDKEGEHYGEENEYFENKESEYNRKEGHIRSNVNEDNRYSSTNRAKRRVG